ncbi:MAG: hypothetical protein RIC03_11930 [Cyclobacteriaceae bacterium]
MAISSCRDKVICPAFQSTYILDDSVRSIYYSYLWKLDKEERLKYLASQNTPEQSYEELDSLGNPIESLGATTASVGGKVDYFEYVEKYIVPDREVNKSKYGIVKYEPYWLKNQRLRTAPMENVLAPEKEKVDTSSSFVDVGEFLASDFSTDSLDTDLGSLAEETSVDSTGYALPTLARAPPPPPKKKTKYLYRYNPKDKANNVEQDYYNKYFGQYLIERKPEPKPEPIDTAAVNEEEIIDESDTTKMIEKKGFGFRFNFGKKKNKKGSEEADAEIDSLDQSTPQIDNIDLNKDEGEN